MYQLRAEPVEAPAAEPPLEGAPTPEPPGGEDLSRATAGSGVPIEPGDELPHVGRRQLLQMAVRTAPHLHQEPAVDRLLHVGLLRQHEHRLAEVERLADELVGPLP